MILLVGTLPPPVGGVSIHCQRLLVSLNDRGFKLKFLNSRDFFSNCYTFFRLGLRTKGNVVHIHVSSPIALALYVLAALILSRSEILITIHANYKRTRSFIDQFCLNIAIVFASKVFVLNKSSYEEIIRMNKAAILSTSFIPCRVPLRGSKEYKKLSCFALSDDGERLSSFGELHLERYSKVVSTTAWKLIREKGRELYGVVEIIDLSDHFPSVLFVVSDPSGEYFDCAKSHGLCHSNVVYITQEHAFVEVLSFSDLFIRNTSTDGDATSVREALYMGVPVVATSTVDRPIGCITYKKLSRRLVYEMLFANDHLLPGNVKVASQGCETKILPREVNVLEFYDTNFMPQK